jgi:hypothetical protein
MTAKDAPPSASDQEAEGIPGTVIVLGVNRNIVLEKHQNQVDRRYDPMP